MLKWLCCAQILLLQGREEKEDRTSKRERCPLSAGGEPNILVVE